MGGSTTHGQRARTRFGERREATREEYRAMANPLRLRIIRACLYEPLTNKEIAGVLGIEPASSLHHVRLLVRTGFLEPVEPRPGPRGSTEKPYRSTGKSWILEAPTEVQQSETWLASIDAVRQELEQAGPGSEVAGARLGLKLSPARASELAERLEALLEEYAEADPDPDPDGTSFGLYVVFHRLAERRR